MNYIKKLFSAYATDYPKLMAYMMQASEYRTRQFFNWWFRIGDFRGTKKRGDLIPTRMGNLLRLLAIVSTLLYLLLSVLTISYFMPVWWEVAVSVLLLILLYPICVTLAMIFPVHFFRIFIYLPREKATAKKASKIFRSHKAIKVAIAGSYGKTSMKELLSGVLADGKRIACTEGNRNTLRSIAEFAFALDGSEDVLLIEFGEAESGDIARMTQMVGPDFAVITGLAPNHLDGYEDVDDIAHDFLTLVACAGKEASYINGDNMLLREKLGDVASAYDIHGSLGNVIERPHLEVNKSSFTLTTTNHSLKIESGLIGQHNIAVLGFVAGFAKKLGITEASIQASLVETRPYEHRMEPRKIHGAWLIDDTYNGSIEGMRAGLSLLKQLKTTGRKIYVTPGLVDQGVEVERVHAELGKLIAQSHPDEVYLMENSVSDIIEASLVGAGYKGKVKIISEPLQFYQNLESILAKDDIIMCQNDWPDYYN